MLAVLSIRYGTNELSMVEFQLAQKSTRVHAVAMEWLDVTLVGTERASVALLEPDSSAAERLAVLTRWFPLSPTTPEAVLVDIADDPDDVWRHAWLTACAVLAGAEMPELGLDDLASIAADTSGESETGDPTDIVWETITALRRRRTAQPV